MRKEVVVLGAGMVGTATALSLQARGFAVVLLDRASPGGETSFGNAGIIQGEACEPYALPRDFATLLRIALKADNSVDWDVPGLWHAAPALLSYWRHSAPARHHQISQSYAALIQRATRDHDKWIAASASQNLIRRNGYRHVFRDKAAFERLSRKADQWRAQYGVGHDVEDSAALAAAEPALRRPLTGAIHWHDAWSCSDPGALVQSYATLFVQRGGEPVTAGLHGLQQFGAGWKITTSAGSIEAEHVVMALGPWSPHMVAPLGYQIGMIRKRGYHMHFEYPRAGANPPDWRLNLPLIDPAIGAVYAPMRAGLRIATGADLSARIVSGTPRQLTRAIIAARELLEIGAPVEESAWSGVRPCLPDMMPLTGAAPRHRGLWFNFGHGHQGFTLGPTTGELLAGVMAGDPDPVAAPLAPSRMTFA